MNDPNARTRIVDAARSLFWEQGFGATSLAQISDRSGAMPGSIYYFFKTKAEILEAVIEHYQSQLSVWLIDPVFERTANPRERIFGIIDTYRTFLVETHFKLGCPVGGLAQEVASTHEFARVRIAQLFDDLVGTMAGCLEELGSGRLPAQPGVKALATMVMSVIEGGIIQARAAASIEPFDQSVGSLERYFDFLLEGTR